jgi:hypothetical protein
MEETPPTLWVYAAATVISALIAFVRTVDSHPAAVIFVSLGVFILIALVLRGSRVVWCLVVVAYAFGLLNSFVFSPRPWWTTVFDVVALSCLLAPVSWRFVWRPRSSPEGPRTSPTTDDASGWHIDPRFPSRMRYWNAEDQRWLGIAKTPRKLRKQWLLHQGEKTKSQARN